MVAAPRPDPRPARPSAPLVEHIPQELRARRQWVVWRYAWRHDAWTKVPYNPRTGGPARSHDAEDKRYPDRPEDTWGTLDQAMGALTADPDMDGIGYVFSADDPYTGVDADHCLDARGHLDERGRWILSQIASYTEYSPSRTGLHLICRGIYPNPTGKGRKRNGVEMYTFARFFTFTGARYAETPAQILDATGGLAAVYARYLADAPTPLTLPPNAPPVVAAVLSNSEVLQKARRAANGPDFIALYDRGDCSAYLDENGQPDESRADAALCAYLAFYTRSAAQIESLMDASALGHRAKWRNRADYRRMTIDGALAVVRETYQDRPRMTTPTPAAPPSVPPTDPPAPVTVGDDNRAPQPLADGFPPGDVGNAQRFMHYFGQDVKYTLEWGWLVWDGQRWACDTTGLVRLKAQGLRDQVIRHALAVEDRRGGDDLLTLAKKLGQTATINNLLTEAAPMAGARTLDFDRNPWLLNCANGTLNLQTGALHPHSREDMLSKVALAPYDAGANPQLWRLFIWRTLDSATDVIGFMQRALGYSITGSTREQALFIMYGSGSNGKSTLWGTVQRLLGDYALNTPVKTLLRKERDNAINNDVARMVGARFVTASEPDVGKHLDVATVKDLTGGDPITARFLNKEYFTFDPILKIWLSTNHKPIIRDTTNSIWRRINLIPFTVKFSDADKDVNLLEKLTAEGPGILAWLVEGCQRWLAGGLQAPESVRAAGEAYRQEMDPLGPFLTEYCETGKSTYEVTHKSLYSAYVNWCEECGEKPVSRRALTDMLTERGYQAEEHGTGNLKTWSRIQLRTLTNQA